MKRNSIKRRCTIFLTLGFLLFAMSVGLYLSAKETLNRAEATYKDAEELFIAAEILNNKAEAARKAAEEAEPEQVIVVVEDDAKAVPLTQKSVTPPLSCLETATEPESEPVPEQVSMGNYTITAYCPCEICCGYWARTRPLDENGKPIVYTASGALAKAGVTIAVDPSVIPHGTSVWFEGPGGMNEYIAQDTGSAVDGYHIDLYFDSHEEALAWGSQTREVFREVNAK